MPPAAGYTFWADASDTDRLWKSYNPFADHPADTEAIKAWDDEGDAANMALIYSVAGPAYDADGFNGRGCLDFDGSDDKLYLSDDAYAGWLTPDDVISASAWTMFIAFIMEGAAGSNASYVSNDRLLGDGQYWGVYLSTDAGVHKCSAFQYDTGGKYATTNISLDTKYVVCAKYDGTGSELSVTINNGTPVTTSSVGNVADLTTQSVIMGGVGELFNGKVGEIVIYDTALSGTNLSDTWSYLLGKWVNSGSVGGKFYNFYRQLR